MALESAQWIHQLVKNNPEGTDPISQGDNHITMIKSVLQDTFPSNFDGAMIPDISGKAGHILAVNADGDGVEWVPEPVIPPIALEWWDVVGEPTSVPIDTWTKLNVSKELADDGVYVVAFGIHKWGAQMNNDFKENGIRLDLNDVIKGNAQQYTATYPSRASYAFLHSSAIIPANGGDILTLQVFQDNNENISVTVEPTNVYLQVFKIA